MTAQLLPYKKQVAKSMVRTTIMARLLTVIRLAELCNEHKYAFNFYLHISLQTSVFIKTTT